jgi:hypothetical protein
MAFAQAMDLTTRDADLMKASGNPNVPVRAPIAPRVAEKVPVAGCKVAEVRPCHYREKQERVA